MIDSTNDRRTTHERSRASHAPADRIGTDKSKSSSIPDLKNTANRGIDPHPPSPATAASGPARERRIT